MSAPARVLPRGQRFPSGPRTRPGGPGPRPVPGARPAVRRRPAQRAGRGRVAFLVVSTALVSSAVTGVAALSALVAQGGFRIQALEQRIDGLSEAYRVRTEEAARLSAPRRVAAWARRHGMRLPDEIHILHVPGLDRAAPAGAPAISRPGPGYGGSVVQERRVPGEGPA